MYDYNTNPDKILCPACDSADLAQAPEDSGYTHECQACGWMFGFDDETQ